MVSKTDYLKYCHNADIPVTLSERRVLNELTRLGDHFDPAEYQGRCDEAGIPITGNQRKIMKWLPTPEDDTCTMMGKLSELKRMVLDMWRRNKYGV